MCGIAGVVDLGLSRTACLDMTDALRRRGPDDGGCEEVWIHRRHGWFGHRRLSIFDLSPAGHQPMRRNGWSITFNGEIYNFISLRRELEKIGYSFSSSCDTEVILDAFDAWGVVEALKKFNGMFAIAATDGENLYLARDRWGIKPLYYYLAGTGIAFASTLSAFEHMPGFERRIAPEAYRQYLVFGYVPAPLAIYEKTYKLESGRLLTWRDGRIISTDSFCDREFSPGATFRGSETEAVDRLDKLITDSVRLRLAADRPVGSFLSGGIDSTLVSAIAQKLTGGKLRTFSVGFEDEAHDESEKAFNIARHLGTRHQRVVMTRAEMLKRIPGIPDIYGEPHYDTSILPVGLVSEAARRDVGVALSGDGGDEYFWGYEYYAGFNREVGMHKYYPDWVRYHLAPLAGLFSPLRGRTWRYRDIGELHLKNIGKFSKRELENLCGEKCSWWKHSSYHQYFLRLKRSGISESMIWPLLDQKFYLESVLTKVDRASMYHGLEVRTPLLDGGVTEFAHQLPTHFKLCNGESKYILKQLLLRYVPRCLWDFPKHGFGAPFSILLRGELGDLFRSVVFSKEPASVNPRLNLEYVKHIYEEYLRSPQQYGGGANLAVVFFFELWRQRKNAYFS